MIPYFPRQISNKAIYLYLGSLLVVSILFFSHSMKLEFLAIGVVWVVGFFLLVSICSKKWLHIPRKDLLIYLFLCALGLRWAWVIFSYIFYTIHTGMPFEFSAADAFAYYAGSVSFSMRPIADVWRELFVYSDGISDSGYFMYLSTIARLTGESILFPRLIHSLFSAATVLLIYFLAQRNLGEEGGRMAAIMACFMPNLIYYCGLHLKETIMIFLVVAFLERADYLIRSRHYTVLTVAAPVLLAASLFSFRTVLGISAVFSFVTALLFTNSRIIGRSKRWTLIVWGILAVLVLWGGSIRSETEQLWETRFENQDVKRTEQTMRGNRWAKYATGTVMAPLMFILPLPTMVDVDEQYNQQVVSGGNYVRTFLGGFVIVAIISAIFIKKNWREFSLIGAYTVVYLAILSSSGFANSERFLLPALPGLLIMASYGVQELTPRIYRYFRYWYYAVPVLIVGWAVFKLGSRGIIF